MNIIKSRKSISNTSPSITHNINFPSKNFQNRSVRTLTSSINSKSRCRCPLIQRPLDYNQLQEMAKEIQEESFEELQNEEEQKGKIDKNEDTTFTNDREEENQILVWTVEPSRQRRCTCTSGKGLTFQQVLNNFQMSSEIKNCGIKKAREPRLSLLPTRKSTRIPLNPTISKHRTRNWVKSTISNNNIPVVETPRNDYKEQKSNLQAVLKRLHDEFFALNSTYQELDRHVNKDQASLETLKKLEEMEKALNSKEEEIKTVMSLYRDMLILKNQVKKLKEQKRTNVRLSESLTKSEFQVLKQIQTYQDVL